MGQDQEIEEGTGRIGAFFAELSGDAGSQNPDITLQDSFLFVAADLRQDDIALG